MRNYNTLIGRYPGADGMKTGFICASGFNLVASATRDGKRLIAVVLGAPSSAAARREGRAAARARLQQQRALSWLMPPLGTVESLQPVDAAPPNLRDEMCGGHRKRPAAEDEDDVVAANMAPDSPYAVFLSSLRPQAKGASLLQDVNGRSRFWCSPEPSRRRRAPRRPRPSQIGQEKDGGHEAPAAAAGTAATSAAIAATGEEAATRPQPKPAASPRRQGRRSRPSAAVTATGVRRQPSRSPSQRPISRRHTPARRHRQQPGPRPAMPRQPSRSRSSAKPAVGQGGRCNASFRVHHRDRWRRPNRSRSPSRPPRSPRRSRPAAAVTQQTSQAR